jgi:hypothetical protein
LAVRQRCRLRSALKTTASSTALRSSTVRLF